jgi:hypothetical protein
MVMSEPGPQVTCVSCLTVLSLLHVAGSLSVSLPCGGAAQGTLTRTPVLCYLALPVTTHEPNKLLY